MSSSSTGPININQGRTATPGTPVVSGATLYYICTSSSSNLKLVNCDVSSVQSSGNVSSLTGSVWSNTTVSGVITNANSANFISAFRPAAVVFNNTLYFFWVDTHSNDVYACYQNLGTGSFGASAYKLKWCKASTPTTVAGTVQLACDLSVQLTPDGSGMTLYIFTGKLKFGALYLTPAGIDENAQTWTGVGTASGAVVLSNVISDIDSSYWGVSTAWFSQGNNGNFLIASFYSSKNHQVRFLLCPIDGQGGPTTSDGGALLEIDGFQTRRSYYVARDPSGRIYGVTCQDDNNKYIYYRLFNTNQQVLPNAGVNPSLSWIGDWSNTYLLNGQTNTSDAGLAVAFVASSAKTNQSLTIPTSSGKSGTFNTCTSQVQSSIVLYAKGDEVDSSHVSGAQAFEIYAQGATFGKTYLVPDYYVTKPGSGNQSLAMLSVLLDAFPIPNQNLGSNVSPEQAILGYDYGITSTTQLTANMEWQVLAGIKSSLTTTKGIGPAADLEFSTGPMGSIAAEYQSTNSSGFSVYTSAENAPGSGFQVAPYGSYYGDTLSEIHEDAAVFYDTGSNLINGNQAPLYSMLRLIKASTTQRTGGSYTSYCYTPGDMSTYTASSINARMQSLYRALNSTQQALLNSHYGDGTYVQNVMLPHAQSLGLGEDYLEFSFTGSGSYHSGVEVVSSIMATLGWQFHGSAYAGVSGGEEVSIFGFGEGFDASALVGFQYDLSINAGFGGTGSWGINFTDDAPVNVPGHITYTARMYFLQPNALWANELQLFGSPENAGNIDYPNSQPSKIMFLVTMINGTAYAVPS